MVATRSSPLSRWAPSSARGDKFARKPGARFWFDSRRLQIYCITIYGIASSRSRTKKGSAELMILSLLEDRPRHGYDIAQLIELRHAARSDLMSLPFILCFIASRAELDSQFAGSKEPGQRRRRYYRLTASGKNVLSKQRAGWRELVEAINLITGVQHA